MFGLLLVNGLLESAPLVSCVQCHLSSELFHAFGPIGSLRNLPIGTIQSDFAARKIALTKGISWRAAELASTMANRYPEHDC